MRLNYIFGVTVGQERPQWLQPRWHKRASTPL